MRDYIDMITEAHTDPDLADRIDSFIERHAGIRPDYDPKWDSVDERFTGPDAVMLWQAGQALRSGQPFPRIHSSYGSGTYKPWSDKAAEAEHDELVAAANQYAI
jgi:hypothetical protein